MERTLTTAPAHPLVVILGPTASGKTSLSISIAERFNGELVNCDSVAVYREFEIGTAKPSHADRLRAPHHLLDIVAPTQSFTAGEYSRLARSVLAEITARHHLPIVVGGTGLYLRALIEGLFAGPQRSESVRERLRAIAARKGSLYLHLILTRLDPASARRIHANDAPKLIRALEVCLAARRPMSELFQQGRDPLRGYRILRIGLDPDRSALYARINQRAGEMFASGLLQETAALADRYGDTASALGSLGYKQALAHLRGQLSMADAIAAAQQGHRNYAKRQMTWFRREPDVTWLSGFGDSPDTESQTFDLVSNFLSK